MPAFSVLYHLPVQSNKQMKINIKKKKTFLSVLGSRQFRGKVPACSVSEEGPRLSS